MCSLCSLGSFERHWVDSDLSTWVLLSIVGVCKSHLETQGQVLRNIKIDIYTMKEMITLQIKRTNNHMEGGKAILVGSKLVSDALIIQEGLNGTCCK